MRKFQGGIFLVEIVWLHHKVMCPRVMFTLVIGKVLLAGVPFKRIHILCFFFACPKISHFHGLGSLSFDGEVYINDRGLHYCSELVFLVVHGRGPPGWVWKLSPLGNLGIMHQVWPWWRKPPQIAILNIVGEKHHSIWLAYHFVGRSPWNDDSKLCCVCWVWLNRRHSHVYLWPCWKPEIVAMHWSALPSNPGPGMLIPFCVLFPLFAHLLL